MRLPSLTTSPPIMAGSILMSRSTSLPLTDLSAARSASMCSSLSFSATVTSAVASPLCCATSSRNASDHVAHREQTAVRGHELEKFRREAADAGALAAPRRAPATCSSAENTGLRTRRAKIGAFGNERVEAFEVRFHRVDRIRLAGEIEQSGRIAARHAGDDGFFACHFACSSGGSFGAFPQDPQPARMVGTSPWDLSGTLDIANAAE